MKYHRGRISIDKTSNQTDPDSGIETDKISKASGHIGAQEVTPFVTLSDCQSNPPIGGRLSLFANQWEATTTDTWVLNMVRLGLTLEFLSMPPKFIIRCPISRDRTKRGLMQAAAQHLLDIQAIQPVPEDQWAGILLHLICSPKDLWWVESNSGLVEIEQSSHLQKIQDAVPPVYTGEHLGRQLSSFNRPDGGIPPCASLTIPPAVSMILLCGPTLSVQGPTIQPILNTQDKLLAALVAHLRALPVCVQCYLYDILIDYSSHLWATEDLQVTVRVSRIMGFPSICTLLSSLSSSATKFSGCWRTTTPSLRSTR